MEGNDLFSFTDCLVLLDLSQIAGSSGKTEKNISRSVNSRFFQTLILIGMLILYSVVSYKEHKNLSPMQYGTETFLNLFEFVQKIRLRNSFGRKMKVSKIRQFLTSIILDAKHERIVRNNQYFFSIFIVAAYYCSLELSNKNRKKTLDIPDDV